MIQLLNIYDAQEYSHHLLDAPEYSYHVLWDVLGERTPEQSISHKKMPTYDEHVKFIQSRPYHAWYLVMYLPLGIVDQTTIAVGSVYVTRNREIGIFILKRYHGNGYGTQALAELRRLHPGRLLANVNPLNTASCKFFAKHGAKMIQVTYELEEQNGKATETTG